MKTRTQKSNRIGSFFGSVLINSKTDLMIRQSPSRAKQPIREHTRQTGTTTIIEKPTYTRPQMMQLAAMLAALLDEGLDEFLVLEQCGRVYQIAYTPMGNIDPILPFVFRDYGSTYRNGYKTLTKMLMDRWVQKGFWDYRKARRAANCLTTCVQRDKTLTDPEINYYTTNMMFTIAMPKYFSAK